MAKCYNYDGTPDTGRTPCSADGTPAHCCSDEEICISNGLCLHIYEDGTTSYWENTCTHPDWKNNSVPTCPSNCAETVPRDASEGGNGVDICGKGKFVCKGYHSYSCNSTTTFSLKSFHPVLASASSPSSTSTSTQSNSPTPAPPGSTGKSESDNNLDVGLGVGLGVGIPLVFGVIAAFLFFRRRGGRSVTSSVPTEAYTASLQKKGALSEQGTTLPMSKEQKPPQELATRQARPHIELQ
ncbi:hypothetical protein PENCOP_c011G05242 [Penicillium coprophilum]|uniref:Mid2 domain-containing protein n=1 Tax=Penicillium coprophilum TaxID=36646 RepID=A0A1V6UEA8_9EURO|nr:hypothetical protein PENCOP_c011G05242 [Penicillium coprophilum]